MRATKPKQQTAVSIAVYQLPERHRFVVVEGWANPDSARIDAYTASHSGHWDPAQTTETMGHYIDNVAVPQVRELLTNYGDVAVLWWDTPTDMTDEYAAKLNALLPLRNDPPLHPQHRDQRLGRTP